MPYFETSYDTTPGRAVKHSLDTALKEALVSGNLPNRQLGLEPVDQRRAVFVIGGTTDEMHIPPFVHPYLIRNFKNQDYLVSDVRMFRATSQEFISDKDFEEAVRNKGEYALVKSRAALNLLWLGSGVARIRARFSFAGSVFASWLSQAISKAYALDALDQLRITAVSIYYYHSLFTASKRLEGEALEIAVVHTIKTTKLPAVEIYSLFEKMGEISGIEDYCREVQNCIENVRLRDFNLPLLLNLIRNSWYGANAKEMLFVALEHPPTWIAIVYATLTERTYKSSSLYKIVEMQGKRGNGDEFAMNYALMLKNSIIAVEAADQEIVFRDFEG